MSSPVSLDPLGAAGWQRWSLGAGVVALAISAIAAPFHPEQFFRAYLAAYLFYWGIALGSLAILMIHHLTGGAWGFLIRRILEAATRTLPLLAVLFTPIAWGVGYLYLWAQPQAVAQSEKLQYQQFYLNPAFFWFRAAAYFLLWTAMAGLLNAWSHQQDRTGDPRYASRSMNFSGPGLVVYGITMHFVAIDWIMSLQTVFHSSIFGPLTATGQILSAHAFALVLLARLVQRPPLDEAASLKVVHDLGSLLFTFLVAWAYMAWFQFMLVWIANLPVDIVWYLPRAAGGWRAVAWAIFLLHFAVPFFLLLSRPLKRNPKALARVAGLVLFMQLVFLYYQVMPAFDAPRIDQHWMDFLTPVGIGGIWLAGFARQLAGQPLLPRHDPNRQYALHLRRLDEEEAAREEALLHG